MVIWSHQNVLFQGAIKPVWEARIITFIITVICTLLVWCKLVFIADGRKISTFNSVWTVYEQCLFSMNLIRQVNFDPILHNKYKVWYVVRSILRYQDISLLILCTSANVNIMFAGCLPSSPSKKFLAMIVQNRPNWKLVFPWALVSIYHYITLVHPIISVRHNNRVKLAQKQRTSEGHFSAEKFAWSYH